ncbi:MAG: N-acetylmuramoyl-L-alanine amidase [Firmicutes bacterium]|nr:N-acetylmuramoyl-L-alanine amidase [Bacillota bacterium]
MHRKVVFFVRAKTLFLVLALVVGAASFWVWPLVQETMVPLTEIVSGKIIYIDPGHGGRDPGCVSPQGLTEKELVLDIAIRLKNLFLRSAMDARLTREDDSEVLPPDWDGSGGWKRPELTHRVEQANQGKGKIFLSIHANSFLEPVWSGAQTFYYPGREDSRMLAVSIQNMLVTKLGPNRRKAKPGEFWVLGKVDMPAAMVEVGFLSNPREADLLATGEYRQKVAEAIFEGVVQYLVESKTRRQRSPLGSPGEEETVSLPELPRRKGEVVLYFPGPTNQDDCLVPELRNLPELATDSELTSEELLKLTLEELIDGPGPGSILYPLLPPDTTIQAVEISSEGKISIELGPEIKTAFRGGGHWEELVVYGIVNTVAELFPSSEVYLSIEGEEEATLAGHVWLGRPLHRRTDLICPK